MQNIHPTMRPFVAAIAPPAPVVVPDSTLAEHWAAVALAEACDPNVLRALRDQQQHLQNTGVLS